ncbi:MAG: hypothetical protein LQ340_005162 [Diploschistes diacapsis]|nr:MAG: hypothetical protein LQ340_005162 [Diploschistes diacapsis]
MGLLKASLSLGAIALAGSYVNKAVERHDEAKYNSNNHRNNNNNDPYLPDPQQQQGQQQGHRRRDGKRGAEGERAGEPEPHALAYACYPDPPGIRRAGTHMAWCNGTCGGVCAGRGGDAVAAGEQRGARHVVLPPPPAYEEEARAAAMGRIARGV